MMNYRTSIRDSIERAKDALARMKFRDITPERFVDGVANNSGDTDYMSLAEHYISKLASHSYAEKVLEEAERRQLSLGGLETSSDEVPFPEVK